MNIIIDIARLIGILFIIVTPEKKAMTVKNNTDMNSIASKEENNLKKDTFSLENKYPPAKYPEPENKSLFKARLKQISCNASPKDIFFSINTYNIMA